MPPRLLPSELLMILAYEFGSMPSFARDRGRALWLRQLRFNSGYGNISPRNCFENQETNYRCNNLVFSATGAGEKISLWFFPTPDYKKVEAELRANLRPPWDRV